MLSRRTFLLGSLGAAASTGLAAAGWARFGELHWVEFVRNDLLVPNLPDHLHETLLVQLSDLHVGPRVSDAFLLDTFAAVQAHNPHFVVYTGDFVTYQGRDRLDHVSRVMAHTPRGSLGTVAILGNHDYGHNWTEAHVAGDIATRLADVGIPVLRNAVAEICELHFAGFSDLWSGEFASDLLARRPRDKATIALCHNPDACDLDIWGDYRGPVLAGHTHGGQVSLPFVGTPILPVQNRRYVAGAYDLSGGRTLYVNRALGHSLKVRFGVRPEVTLHRLRRA